jgi:hypothetical protein
VHLQRERSCFAFGVFFHRLFDEPVKLARGGVGRNAFINRLIVDGLLIEPCLQLAHLVERKFFDFALDVLDGHDILSLTSKASIYSACSEERIREDYFRFVAYETF